MVGLTGAKDKTVFQSPEISFTRPFILPSSFVWRVSFIVYTAIICPLQCLRLQLPGAALTQGTHLGHTAYAYLCVTATSLSCCSSPAAGGNIL